MLKTIKPKKLILTVLFLVLLTAAPAMVQAANNFTVEINNRHQTIEGFGGAIAWYHHRLVDHLNKDQIYQKIYDDLNIDILRIQNWYGKETYHGRPGDLFEETIEVVDKAYQALGNDLKIMMSSWTPPPEMKSNEDQWGGTLARKDGEFIYDQFADYWYQSIIAHREAGVDIDYISIQNEPDYDTEEWNSCFFRSLETYKYPGYNKALDAVYERLQGLKEKPKIIGPETIGIGYNTVQTFVDNLDKNKLDIIGFHLYHGGADETRLYGWPDSFISDMHSLRNRFYPEMPMYQTEYHRGDGFNTAWIIHNSLVEQQVNAYLYWSLISTGDDGLIYIETTPESMVMSREEAAALRWKHEDGYYIKDEYYALKHYSRFISPGYQMVEVAGDNDSVKVSAFIGPKEENLVMVLLNTAKEQQTVQMDIPDFEYEDIESYKTVFYEENGPEFSPIGDINSDEDFKMPGTSLLTIVLN